MPEPDAQKMAIYHSFTTDYFTPCACARGKNSSIIIIIESVDSISRDAPDMPLYVIYYKYPNISKQVIL